MIIITGTGRSGTATLAKLLGGHHEFRVQYFLEKYFSDPDPCRDPFLTFDQRLAAVLDLLQGVDERSFVDASNLHIHVLDAVAFLHPGTKFILTVRDGRDFVRSAFSRKWHERNSFGMVPPYGDPFHSLWGDLSPIQKNAWIWQYRNRKALQRMETLPEHDRMILKIEDLGNPNVLASIEAFTGIHFENRESGRTRFNANPSFDFPPAEEWSPRMKEEFRTVAGGMMSFFGYAD